MVTMFLCNECDEPYQSNGDCSGVCEDCRDKLEQQRMLDAMSAEEWEAWHAQQARQSNMLFRSLNNMKLAS
jgi:hypothetical protein